MMQLLEIDWQKLFYPETSLIEMIVRGSVVYLAIYFMLRFLTKRDTGTLGITDLLVLVLLADAAQNAMAGEYNSITDGLVLVLTIIGWSIFINFLRFRSIKLEKILSRSKVLLVINGHFIRENMEKEMITKEELMSEIRIQGIKTVREVKEAYIESDGSVSVIKKEKSQNRKKKQKVV